MAGILARLTEAHTANPELRRRGRLLIIIAVAMTLLALLFIPIVLTMRNTATGLTTLLVGAAVFVGAALLGRAGRVDMGAYLLIGATTLAIVSSLLLSASTPTTPFYLVLPVLMAGVLLPPAQIWSMTVIAIIGVALAAGLLPSELRADPLWVQALRSVPLLLLMVALLTFVSARSLSQALAAARHARAAAEASSAELAATNAALEDRVAERTAEIQHVLAAQQATSAELAASLQAQRDLNQLIAALSVPVIPVSDATLVVPLVGSLDSARIGRLISAVLDQITDTHARMVILDVTGVPLIDTQVAAALLQVASATRLMGAETLLCGIRPEVAQTLVHVGADLSALRTAATLKDSLAQTLAAPRR